jgi:hypothetical protein
MASTTSKVLTGCGIGCLMIIVLAAGLSYMGFRWVRETTKAVEEAGRIERELEDRYGQARDFVPSAAPGVPADRIEAFLAVRDALAEPRDALASAVAGLAGVEGEEGFGNELRVARAGIGLAPRVFEFTGARNRALLDGGMGVGEYTWIYWFTYNAWLGHPADDSELREFMDKRNSENGSVQIHMDGAMEPERVTWRLRRDIKAMLKHLEQELSADLGNPDMLEAVMAELAELDADPERVPWQTGLPEAFAVGLEPYRERLESSYSSAANPFELTNFD